MPSQRSLPPVRCGWRQDRCRYLSLAWIVLDLPKNRGSKMAFSGVRANTVTIAGSEHAAADALKCRQKFLAYFPDGFRDETYEDWERDYKWRAHQSWESDLDRAIYRKLLRAGEYAEIASRAVRIESRTNLLFSFEKMALRDAVKPLAGAQCFAEGLFALLHGRGGAQNRFERWIATVSELPRRQTRVLTWPLVTVFGFIAQPNSHMFLKPNVTRVAAREYGFHFDYASRPNWRTYRSLLAFGERVAADVKDLRPRDLIDIQSFIWVQGSDEYPPKRSRGVGRHGAS